MSQYKSKASLCLCQHSIFSIASMAVVDTRISYVSSSSSDCASEHIAPYIDRPATPFVHNDIRTSPQEKNYFFDQQTKSRLLQLYTTRTPISSPKQIQSHFTCHYLTRSNVHDVLFSNTQTINHHRHSTSSFSNLSSRLDDLTNLLQQSWRVSFGTLDFLELIWTGRRTSKNWADVLTACTCNKKTVDTTTSCPLGVDEDEFLAINLAVTYFYTMEGQPTVSLVAIAMTRDAYNTIAEHIQSQEALTIPPSSPTPSTHLVPTTVSSYTFGFDRTPFVHRDLLLPIVCGWRNASVSSMLNSAAESRAWMTKVLPEEHVSLGCDPMDLDPNTNANTNTKVEEEGSYFFPTIRPEPPLPAPSTSNIHQTITNDKILSPSQRRQQQPFRQPATSPTQAYEFRAALVPGRDASFRSIVSNIVVTLDRQWTRKSSQFDPSRSSQQRGRTHYRNKVQEWI